MSTAAKTLTHDGINRSVLPFPTSPTTQSLERILGQLGNLEPQIVAEIQQLDDAALFELWERLSQVERYAWVGKCACCARIWDKTAEAKRGRGNKDIPQKGILAAVSKISKRFGITPTTVYLNARIFRLLCQVQEDPTNSYTQYNILEVLDEKGYWEHALNAADPVKAILIFAANKTTMPRFRVTDAERLVMGEGMSRKAVALKAVEQVRESSGQLTERQALISHIRSAQDVVRNLIIPGCPDEGFRDRVWEQLLLELEDEYSELFDEDAQASLRASWENGSHREDEMSAATGFPLEDVSRLMQALCNMSEFIRIQTRDVKTRSKFQLWHMVGEPFDNAKFVPQVVKDK